MILVRFYVPVSYTHLDVYKRQGLEWIHFEGIINIGKNFSEKIAREYDWEPCDTIPNLSIKTKNTDYMYCEEFTDDYTSDSFVGEFYFVPSSKQLIFYGEY